MPLSNGWRTLVEEWELGHEQKSRGRSWCPCKPPVQHSPKAPEGTDLYTEIFLKLCFGSLSSQPEPASQGCSYTSLLNGHLPSDWDWCFASRSGCSVSWVAAGHCAGDLQPLPAFSLQENPSSTAFVQMQPGSDSQGSAQPVCASSLELDKAKLAILRDYSKHFPPRLGLPSVCLLRGLWNHQPLPSFTLLPYPTSPANHITPCSCCSSLPICSSVCRQETPCSSH